MEGADVKTGKINKIFSIKRKFFPEIRSKFEIIVDEFFTIMISSINRFKDYEYYHEHDN